MITLMFVITLLTIFVIAALGGFVTVGVVSLPMLLIVADVAVAVFTIWMLVKAFKWLFKKRGKKE